MRVESISVHYYVLGIYYTGWLNYLEGSLGKAGRNLWSVQEMAKIDLY